MLKRTGSDRPEYGTANTFNKTGNGEHVYVYDDNGYIIYDISVKRVKMAEINRDTQGNIHFGYRKLEGYVPQYIKNLFGW